MLVLLTGWAGMALGAAAMAMSRDAALRGLTLASVGFWCAHNALMGNLYAAGMCLLAVAMLSAGVLGWRRVAAGLVALNAALVVPALLSPDPVMAALPVVAGLCLNFGVTFLAGGPMRLACFAGLVLWGVFGVLAGSTPLMVANGLSAAVLVLRGIWPRPHIDKSA